MRLRRAEQYGIEISVIDSGIGIAAEDMANLFQPFRQLSKSTLAEMAKAPSERHSTVSGVPAKAQQVETEYLLEYNQALIRKLEEKVTQLEQTRRELQNELAERRRMESELAEQLEQLQRWQQVTLGRENRIMELKTEVNQLLSQLGQPARYPSVQQKNDGA